MDDANTSGLPPGVDELHAELAASADGANDTAAESAENSAVETVADAPAAAAAGLSDHAAFCEDLAALILRKHSRAVKQEFVADLSALVGESEAQRLGEDAAMSEDMQTDLANRIGRLCEKYGIAQYLSDESVIVASLVTYYFGLTSARADRDDLLRKHGKLPPAKVPASAGETTTAPANVVPMPALEESAPGTSQEPTPGQRANMGALRAAA